MKRCPVSIFRLGKRGLERVLGSLEARVMEALWAASRPLAVREVQEALRAERELSFNTVMTVMNRLAAKGLLAREGGTGPYTYRPRLEREEFVRVLARDVAAGLVRDFGALAASQFVAAVAEERPEVLGEVERLLKEIRSARSSSGRRVGPAR